MDQKKMPERRCIGCMKSFPKTELLRIIRTEEGLRFDPKGRLPGRGAYICRQQSCLQQAIKRNAIGRSLKCSSTREECESLIPQLEEILKQTSTLEVF